MFLLSFGSAAAFSGSGAGTEGDPYQITTCIQLQEMEDELDAYYELANHIECADSADWNQVDLVAKGFDPVGSSTVPFTGVLYGEGFEIRDLYIERADNFSGVTEDDEEYVGLFGYTNGAIIRGVRLVNAYVKGYQYVGGIAGYVNNSTVEDVQVNLAVTPTSDCDPRRCIWARWGLYGGGIAGYAVESYLVDVEVGGMVKGSGTIIGGIVGSLSESSVLNATSSARVDGGQNIGGIAGSSILENVYNSGAVVGTGDDGKPGDDIGGIVGSIEDSEISYATSTGNVTGRNTVGGLVGESYDSAISFGFASGDVTGTNNVIGGLAGRLSGGSITDSSATGSVQGRNNVGGFSGYTLCELTVDRSSAHGNVSGINYVGGFSGYDGCEGPGSTMNQVFATGDVTVESGSYIGGFIGQADTTTITDAYASGDVLGGGEAEAVGGFAGVANRSIFTNVYAAGLVTGNSGLGGLIGTGNVSDGEVAHSFWDTQTSEQDISASGTPKTTLEMKNRTTFTTAGWNFATIWSCNTSDNAGYPFLRFEGFDNDCDVDDVEEEQVEQTRRSSGGTSIRVRVERLEAQNRIEEASEIREQFPGVFGANSDQSNMEQRIAVLQKQLMQLLDLFRQITGQDYTGVIDTNPGMSPVDVSGLEVRDLYRGLRGEDVRALQVLLINHNAGPKALELQRVTATGFFVGYTEEALIEYQEQYKITPATGYFGSSTRAHMKEIGLSGLWW